jgi:hypothetical protein
VMGGVVVAIVRRSADVDPMKLVRHVEKPLMRAPVRIQRHDDRVAKVDRRAQCRPGNVRGILSEDSKDPNRVCHGRRGTNGRVR